jgi:hypothetical protein
MFPPRDTWDRLPVQAQEFLRKYEADLPRIDAEIEAMPPFTPEQVEKLRYQLLGTTGARNAQACKCGICKPPKEKRT